jgi:hypothetical protein
MDDVWCPRMEEVETLQDLTAPRLEHLKIDLFETP